MGPLQHQTRHLLVITSGKKNFDDEPIKFQASKRNVSVLKRSLMWACAHSEGVLRFLCNIVTDARCWLVVGVPDGELARCTPPVCLPRMPCSAADADATKILEIEDLPQRHSE
jgi:hypothetical protein